MSQQEVISYFLFQNLMKMYTTFLGLSILTHFNIWLFFFYQKDCQNNLKNDIIFISAVVSYV